jgi:hypothetical protein
VPVTLRGHSRLRMRQEPGQEGLWRRRYAMVSLLLRRDDANRAISGRNIPRVGVLGGGDMREDLSFSGACLLRDDGVTCRRLPGYRHVLSALALRRRLPRLSESAGRLVDAYKPVKASLWRWRASRFRIVTAPGSIRDTLLSTHEAASVPLSTARIHGAS